MRALQDLEIFVRTADAGSLSAAARTLDITPAAASAALKRLEAELQAPLFLRSTRSLRLTGEGEHFLVHCRIALEALRDGQAALAERNAVRGVLQIAAPSDLGRNMLIEWLSEFGRSHPGIRYRLHLSDRMADFYRQSVDIAIRYGEPQDSSLIVLPLAPHNRRLPCASPAYLARHGMPASPQDLAAHDCLCFMTGDDVHDRWSFQRGEETLTLRVRAAHVANDGDVVRRWAIAGLGVACKSELDVAQDIAAGRLVPLCPGWKAEPAPLHLACADRRQITPAIRLLRDFLRERCEQVAGLAVRAKAE